MKLTEWNKWNKNNDTRLVNGALLFVFSVCILIALLYYFFAFYVLSDPSQANNILEFNSGVSHTFPGVASRSIRGEELYGNGRYIQFISGASLIISIVTTILSLLIITKLNLWTDYSNDDNSHIKMLFGVLVLILFVLLLYHYSYLDTGHHQKYTYRFITISMQYVSLSLVLSGIGIGLIDRLVFWFRSKFSTSKE